MGSFIPAPIVKLGTTIATVSLATATSITVAVPASLAVGNSAITLSNLDGTGVVNVGTFNVTAPAATVLAAPTGVTATAASATQISLSWNAVPGAVHYRIYRSTTSGLAWSGMTNVLLSPTTALFYNDTGLAAGTTYYYKIMAVNAVSFMDSAEVSATTQVSGGALPPGYILQGGLSWKPPVGASPPNTYCNTALVNGVVGRLPTQAELDSLRLSGRTAAAGWNALPAFKYTKYVWSSTTSGTSSLMVDLGSGSVASDFTITTTGHNVTCVSPNNTMDATSANISVANLYVGTPMNSITPLVGIGGATPYTYSYTGTLPAGLNFDSTTGAVSGTPTASYATSTLVFSVTDANNVTPSTTGNVSFSVDAPTWPSGYVAQGGLWWTPVSSTSAARYNLTQAGALCAGAINGLTGWRLPTQSELSALFQSGAINGQGWTFGVFNDRIVWANSGAVDLVNGQLFSAVSAGSLLLATCVR